MVKFLASDLDGTLLVNGEFTKENQKAIKEMRDKGYKFAVSTGRPLNGVDYLFENTDVEVDYYILLNGAFILDKDKNIILKKDIEFQLTKDIISKCEKDGVLISVETGIITYFIKNENKSLTYPNTKLIKDIELLKDMPISLISMQFLEDKQESIDNIVNEINSNYKDVIAYRNKNFIDIVPQNCSKGHAVKSVGENLNINLDNIYTIGDSWNDLSMFEITKNSFTLNDAEEELKKSVNNVVESVAMCINDYIMK